MPIVVMGTIAGCPIGRPCRDQGNDSLISINLGDARPGGRGGRTGKEGASSRWQGRKRGYEFVDWAATRAQAHIDSGGAQPLPSASVNEAANDPGGFQDENQIADRLPAIVIARMKFLPTIGVLHQHPVAFFEERREKRR